MTDYSERSNTQINLEIGLLLGITDVRDVPNYCNDWAAIGPIIGPILEYLMDSKHGDTNWKRCMGFYKCGPKRAAAICFLMMQEERA